MTSLNKLLYRNLLFSSLIPLLVIEVALLGLYFGINHYTTYKSIEALQTDVIKNLRLATSREAQNVDAQLRKTTSHLKLIQSMQKQVFDEFSQCDKKASEPTFGKHKNGAYYRKIGTSENASVYYSSQTQLSDFELKKIACSEALDPLLKSVVEAEEAITQAYVNTPDNMVRVYPFIEDIPSVLGPSLELTNYNFYYLADEKHNPQRKSVWTNSYLDPAGQGWMISNIGPIYKDDKLIAIAGIDITVKQLIKHILDLSLPRHTAAFIVDADGTIMGMQSDIQKLLKIEELTDHEYSGVITGDVFKPSDYNLRQSDNPQIAALYETISLGGDNIREARIDDTELLVNTDTITETDWKLVTVVDKSQLLEPITKVSDISEHLGWLAISIMIIFYLVFFVFLKDRASKLSERVAQPLKELSEQSKDLENIYSYRNIDATGISEIDQLTLNFSLMAQAISERAEQLIESNQAKSAFLSNMSHELRTPLNAIIGFSQLTKNDANLTSEQKDNLNIIHDSGQHLLKLINQILNINKLAQNKYQFDMQKVRLSPIITSTIQMLSQAAEKKQLSLSYTNTLLPDEVCIEADEMGIKQVMINLISNAIKFTEQGKVSILLEQTPDQVIIHIIDTGIGISEADQYRITEPFEQVKGQSSIEGTGLGLAISKQYIEKMGGAFQLASTLGQGTKISIAFDHYCDKQTPESA